MIVHPVYHTLKTETIFCFSHRPIPSSVTCRLDSYNEEQETRLRGINHSCMQEFRLSHNTCTPLLLLLCIKALPCMPFLLQLLHSKSDACFEEGWRNSSLPTNSNNSKGTYALYEQCKHRSATRSYYENKSYSLIKTTWKSLIHLINVYTWRHNRHVREPSSLFKTYDHKARGAITDKNLCRSQKKWAYVGRGWQGLAGHAGHTHHLTFLMPALPVGIKTNGFGLKTQQLLT